MQEKIMNSTTETKVTWNNQSKISNYRLSTFANRKTAEILALHLTPYCRLIFL